MVNELKASLELESMATLLFQRVAAQLQGRFISLQLMNDDNFVHRRDRTSNDIHLFLELPQTYFHLRSYTRHMLLAPTQVADGKIFLTGYTKQQITLTGGNHSLEQKWYHRDPVMISQEIIRQNPTLF